jgi:predicted nucleotidyltransferase
MVEKAISIDIQDSIMKYVEEVAKKYEIDAIILFGSYAKGNNTEDSDIDIAIISKDFEDIDARIEPHPIKTEDYEEKSNPFIQEIINTGIKVA